MKRENDRDLYHKAFFIIFFLLSSVDVKQFKKSWGKKWKERKGKM